MVLPRHFVARFVAGLVLAGLVLAGCRVDARVDVTVADDGSGVVRVAVVADADAADRGGVADGVRVDDLEAAGWEVSSPQTATDGSVTLAAEKPFASADQLPAVLAEVSSAFDQISLERDRSFGEVRWTLRGEIDLSSGPTALGDEQLAALLGGQALGRDLAALEQEIGSSIAEATSLTFVVNMPGGSADQWTFQFGQPVAPVVAEGKVTDDGARLLAAVAIAAAGVLVFVLALIVLRARRRRRRRRQSGATAGGASRGQTARGQTARGTANEPGDDRFALPDAPRVVGVETAPRRLQLVVAATSGVLWDPHEVAERWLGDLSAMQGGTTSLEHVHAVLHEAALGRLGSAEVWHALGVSGDPAELDAAFLSRFNLAPGVVDLVTTLARRGIGVACISDDVAEWSTLLRGRFGLERFIRPWVLSADVGARPPSPSLLEAVTQQASIAASNCLMLDVDLAMLDAARDLGMSTVWLGEDGAIARARGHGHASDLADLLARRRGDTPLDTATDTATRRS